MVSTIWPWLPMRMKALGAKPSELAASLRPSGRLRLNISPPPAAADGAAHGVVDVGIARMRVVRQRRRGGHDLSRLAVAALHDFTIEPGLLDPGACRRSADRLDRRHARLADAVDRGDAGARGDAVDVHGAGPAQRHTAAEFRAGHAEHVAEHPEQRRVAIDVDAVRSPIDLDGEGHGRLTDRWVA